MSSNPHKLTSSSCVSTKVNIQNVIKLQEKETKLKPELKDWLDKSGLENSSEVFLF